MRAQFRTLKEALGWYAARRRGPRARRQHCEPRVQAGTPADGHALAVRMGLQIAAAAGSAARLDRWLAWARKADGAVALGGTDRDRLAQLRGALEAMHLLEVRAAALDAERLRWQSLPDGAWRSTVRLRAAEIRQRAGSPQPSRDPARSSD